MSGGYSSRALMNKGQEQGEDKGRTETAWLSVPVVPEPPGHLGVLLTGQRPEAAEYPWMGSPTSPGNMCGCLGLHSKLGLGRLQTGSHLQCDPGRPWSLEAPTPHLLARYTTP